MSDLIAMGDFPSRVLFIAIVAIAIAFGILLALAPTLAPLLLRLRARRLPSLLSARLLEEWLAETEALESHFGKLSFAAALALTRTKSLVEDDDTRSLVLSPADILISVPDVMVPSDFPIRLTALTLDWAMSLMALYATRRVLAAYPSLLSVSGFLLNILWFLGMSIYCVQRFGGTPGKILTKLRIVTTDGAPLRYKHAVLRSLPELLLLLLGGLMTVLIVSTMAWTDYIAMSSPARRQVVRGLIPDWFFSFFCAALFAWSLGEIMAFFSSDERRALHDRIAGTIVVHKIPTVIRHADELGPRASAE
ncbi:MAG TPA: RDD family protein [Vicinamibacterales bacterium]|nr:RDD family protein [Vicinamibacterales bacterium]